MLGCNRVVGRHTSENIMMWFEEVISEFNIAEKLKHVITDSWANVKKAFVTLPGYEEDLVDFDELNNGDEEEEQEHFELVPMTSEELFFKHHACFPDALQLVVKDGLKKQPQSTLFLNDVQNLWLLHESLL